MEKIAEVNQLGKERLMSKARGNIYWSLTLYLIKILTPSKNLLKLGNGWIGIIQQFPQAAKRLEPKGKKDKEIKRIKERVIELLKKN